jgi:hypothetical protein
MKPVWIIDDDRSIRWVRADAREYRVQDFSSMTRRCVLASETPQVVVSGIMCRRIRARAAAKRRALSAYAGTMTATPILKARSPHFRVAL